MVLIEGASNNILAVLVATGAFRTAMGYLENIFKDGKVTKYELGLGVATLFRIGAMTIGFYLPLSALGLDAAAIASGGSAVVLDFILSKFKIKKPEEEE
ncbi:hypothetical protein LCGC14_2416840 [marine sediment metagenome]|uniref:Uncharacterized protein n=1 Tax=marine sediment metagenome TaxID=412755 RepID=A0A0F9E314_9ZZZZ